MKVCTQDDYPINTIHDPLTFSEVLVRKPWQDQRSDDQVLKISHPTKQFSARYWEVLHGTSKTLWATTPSLGISLQSFQSAGEQLNNLCHVKCMEGFMSVRIQIQQRRRVWSMSIFVKTRMRQLPFSIPLLEPKSQSVQSASKVLQVSPELVNSS